MYNLEYMYEHLKMNLSKKRYNHCINVGEMAEFLAKIYKSDTQKAYVAGILHDITKEMIYEKQMEIAKGVSPPKGFSKDSYKVFHGWTGSIYAKNKLGVEDEEILNAIKFHTTGRKNMSLLEKIVFASDCISAERNFKGVEYFRRVAQINLEEVIVDKLSVAIEKCTRAKRIIIMDTFEAYNEMILKGFPKNFGKKEIYEKNLQKFKA